jgi:hypothetical protein
MSVHGFKRREPGLEIGKPILIITVGGHADLQNIPLTARTASGPSLRLRGRRALVRTEETSL